MKRLLLWAASAVALTLPLSSCDSPTVTNKPASIGAPYEILVLCPAERWDSQLGGEIRSALTRPVVGLNSYEPLYKVLRVPYNNFTGMMQRNRNVLNVMVAPDKGRPSMTAQYDVYATPQIIVSLSAPDDSTATAYVSQYSDELVAIFEIAERNRDLAANRRYGGAKVSEKIEEIFSFTMPVSKGYKIRNAIREKNFMWLSYEYPTASQGIMIYAYPYEGLDDFSQGKLLMRRNEFTALVPGEAPGSHMTTADAYLPDLAHRRINGRAWAELRGFWDVKGDFMGGPFVSYSTLDAGNNRVVTIDLYVYSPNKDKRNFMRGVEHLIFGVAFPGDKSDEQATEEAGE